MKTRTAILIAGIGVILSLCVGVLGGTAAGIYVSQLAPRALSQSLPLVGQTQPNQTQPYPNIPGLPNVPGLTQPNGNGANPALPNGDGQNPFRGPGRNFQFGNVNGAVVMQVVSGSPAEKGGLQIGDVITAVDGQTVDANHALNDLVASKKPGDTLTLTITRGTETKTITVTLGTNPDNNTAPYLGIRFTMFQAKPSGQSG